MLSFSAPKSRFKSVFLERFPPLFSFLCLLCFLLIHSTAPAFAQQSQQELEAEEEAREAQLQEEARKKALSKAPPSALPGVENNYEEPYVHSNNDTNPTQALFEAINKGSMNAAREAIGRGADITARNVLDQTPLDMAIDLNRNNIVFLLLSLRGYNPEGHLIKTSSHENETNGLPSRVSASAEMHLANPQKEAPHYDPSGGVPIPEIGFLGFGPVTKTKITRNGSGLTPKGLETPEEPEMLTRKGDVPDRAPAISEPPSPPPRQKRPR